MTATPFFKYDNLTELDLPFTGTLLDDSYIPDFLPNHAEQKHSLTLLSGMITATSSQYIFGGSLADTLTLNGITGKNVGFSLGAGKDVVVISKSFFGVLDTSADRDSTADDGDSITLKGGHFGGELYAGAGADSVTISGGSVADAHFDLGSGDDKFKSSVSIWRSSIDLGEGNNSFSGTSFSSDSDYENDDFFGGTGNDSLVFTGSFGGTLSLGTGKDSFSSATFSGSIYGSSALGSATLASQVKTIAVKKSGYGTIDLGEASDIVTFGADYGGNFYGDGGDDKLTIGRDAKDPFFDFGAGNDSLIIKRDLLINYSPENVYLAGVNLGIGDDIVSIGRCNQGSIDLNEGFDRLTINGDNLGWIDAGAGDDIITLNRDNGMKLLPAIPSDASPSIVITSLQDVSGDIYLGAGNDQLTIKGDSLSGSILAGLGNDTVTLKGDSNSYINLGDGNDSLSLAGSQNGQIYAGSGNDLINIKGDLNWGDHGAQIDLGTGDDTLIVLGDITDGTVSCGGGHDLITVKGYSQFNLTSSGSSGIIQLGNEGNYLLPNDQLSLSIKGGSGTDIVDIFNIDLASGVSIDFGGGVDYLTVFSTLHGLPETQLKNLEVLRLGSETADHVLSLSEIKAISTAGSSEFRIITHNLSTLKITDSASDDGAFDHSFFAEDGSHQVYSSGGFDILIQFAADIHIA
jgi:hypothetical protein